LIVLGPQRLPQAMRTVGRVVGEVRRVSTGFQQELRDAFEDSDVAEAASPPRRREGVPLAAAVAEIDSEPDEPDEAAVPSGDGAADGGHDTSVAPVVAEALDAIVPPSEQVASDGPPPTESGPEIGDERAAS
jgi:sec-independent protein translocase protein TatB